MQLERPTRETIERDVRAAMVAHEIPCVMPVHDGPPVFDKFHEQLVTMYTNDLDALWSRFVEAFKLSAVRTSGTSGTQLSFDLTLDLSAEPALMQRWYKSTDAQPCTPVKAEHSCGVCLDGESPCPVVDATQWTCLACGRIVGTA